MAKIITPAVTALDEHGKPDYEGNAKILEFLAKGGVDGVLLLGSTGEFTGLTKDEKHDYLAWCAAHKPEGIDLYAGTGSLNYEDTVALTREVAQMGYKAALVIGPCYYAISQEELFTYYDGVAKAVEGAPMFVYNFPARTGHSVAPATLRRLIEANANILGVKDSVQEPGHTRDLALAVRGLRSEGGFEVYSGFDDQFVNNQSFGGAGGIGGISNVAPELWAALVAAANTGDYKRVMVLQGLVCELMPLYGVQSNCPLVMKHLMRRRGVDIRESAIFPFDQVDEETLRRTEQLLDGVLARFRELED